MADPKKNSKNSDLKKEVLQELKKNGEIDKIKA
jgi:hypothetical protein